MMWIDYRTNETHVPDFASDRERRRNSVPRAWPCDDIMYSSAIHGARHDRIVANILQGAKERERIVLNSVGEFAEWSHPAWCTVPYCAIDHDKYAYLESERE